MAELIDRQALIELVEESKRNNFHKTMQNQKAHKYEHEGFLRLIDRLPVADAVEVVRCKDCIHRCICAVLYRFNTDDFCSYGKRRKDND